MEEVSVDIKFYKYKLPRLNIDTNRWPILRKPVLLTLFKHLRLLEYCQVSFVQSEAVDIKRVIT
jgi:hypothetical protein